MASSSSSLSFINEWKYDVFISFRGIDTRSGFTGSLHRALSEKEIKSFMDDQDLEKGAEINPALDEAIQNSMIALVILSKNYASSTFCLDELEKIMDCSKDKGMFVLPVFYEVGPSDVRYQKGKYADALNNHEARIIEKEKIEKWRVALTKIANLSGWHFNHDRYEYELIDIIVQDIIKKIHSLRDGEKDKIICNGDDKYVTQHDKRGNWKYYLGLERADSAPKRSDVSQRGLSLSLLAGCKNMFPQMRRRKLMRTREIFLQQNGIMLLQPRKHSHNVSSIASARVFTAEELKKATNNYDEHRILGEGIFGIVYKGVLSNNKVVAVKKYKISNQSGVEQLINEAVILSQINHRNVVKLLGCCLETEFPLLVYEFITNGTLSDHLHVKGDQAIKLSWTTRLRVAAETAEALAYLHSTASIPIIHRNVKPSNILLDDNLTAKVYGFAISKLVPFDQAQLTTEWAGSIGYIDPEYFYTNQLTEKCDVYSFGVVLAELLTSKNATVIVYSSQENDPSYLSAIFVSSMRKGCLWQILDNDMVNDSNMVHVTKVADLAKRCLNLKGEERPSMKEVAMELEGIRVMEKYSLEAASNVSEL